MSAEIAYRFVTVGLADFGAEAGITDPGLLDQDFVHLHVPEGAAPKDRPSGRRDHGHGAALARPRSGRRRNLGMTGELTLTGRGLPVGGIRKKVIAAKRARANGLILPDANRWDFDELPAHVREGLTVHFMADCPEVARLVFG